MPKTTTTTKKSKANKAKDGAIANKIKNNNSCNIK
jgi:hypothetical protein